MGSAVCGQSAQCFCWGDDHEQRSLQPKARGSRRDLDAEVTTDNRWPGKEEIQDNIQQLFHELFNLHDLNGNGLLEESELIALNEKIAVLHHGPGTDTTEVRAKYESLFRERFDPNGRPVGFDVFHGYATEVLDLLDPDPEAQEMILEQFVAEAKSARELFHAPDMATKDQQRAAQRLAPPHGLRGLYGPASAASSRCSSGVQPGLPAQACIAQPLYALCPTSPAPAALYGHPVFRGMQMAVPPSPAAAPLPPRTGTPTLAQGLWPATPSSLRQAHGPPAYAVGVVAPGGWPRRVV